MDCRNQLRAFASGLGTFLVVALAFNPLSSPALRAADSVRVAVGSETGMAGESVFIPISLQYPDQVKLGRVTVELEFPSQRVQFNTSRISLALETAGGRMEAQQENSPEVNTLVVRLVVEASKPLPAGTIGSLELRIAEPSGPDREIPLHIRKVEAVTLDGKTVDHPGREDGKITVAESPPTLVNCFFFTH